MGADMEEQNSCGFEGLEKRLEVDFEEKHCNAQVGSHGLLRSLSRAQLDEMLTAAECTIVNDQHNEWFDTYVLSESSLFVSPRRIILKTCGRTRLLNAVPVILRHASSLSLRAWRCKYTRGTFIFPDAQPFPYTSFNEEVRILDELFAPMLLQGSRSAHVLDGHPDSGSSNWHIYTAVAGGEHAPFFKIENSERMSSAAGECNRAPFFSPTRVPFQHIVAGEEHTTTATQSVAVDLVAEDFCTKASSDFPHGSSCNTYTLEMCMTQLHPSAACHFRNPLGEKSGASMTHHSGIFSLLPTAIISDFAFTPCGYSMNGLEKDALSTIHITPEEGHSYASFEVMGYDPSLVDLQALINRVVACFKPGSLVMSIHCSTGNVHGGLKSMCNSWCTSKLVPQGYVCNSSVRQELGGYAVVAFHTFTRRSSKEEFGVIPKPLCLQANPVNGTTVNGIHADTLCEDAITVPSIRGSKAKYELEDSILDMVALEDYTAQTPFTYSLYDHLPPLSIMASYRGAYEGLQTHHQAKVSCEVVTNGGKVLTMVDSEKELLQLQRCCPNAQVVLRLRPEHKGCNVGLSPNAEELLRRSKRLGLEVVGIAVDVGVDPCVAMGGHDGAILRAASRVCMSAKALGLPHLKVLAIGECA